MKITYRQKQKYGKGYFGTGIQVDHDASDAPALKKLIAELAPLGFKHNPSGNFKYYFFKDGSLMFGLKTAKENNEFMEQSYHILVKYDPYVGKTVLPYDND